MSIVKIKDAKVVRVNRSGFGVQVQEPEKQSNGRTFKGDRFTIWFTDPHGLSEGDTVSLSGFLSAKVGEAWTDREGNERHSVELSVNQPRVDGDVQVQSDAEPADEWSAPASNDSVPF